MSNRIDHLQKAWGPFAPPAVLKAWQHSGLTLGTPGVSLDERPGGTDLTDIQRMRWLKSYAESMKDHVAEAAATIQDPLLIAEAARIPDDRIWHHLLMNPRITKATAEYILQECDGSRHDHTRAIALVISGRVSELTQSQAGFLISYDVVVTHLLQNWGNIPETVRTALLGQAHALILKRIRHGMLAATRLLCARGGTFTTWECLTSLNHHLHVRKAEWGSSSHGVHALHETLWEARALFAVATYTGEGELNSALENVDGLEYLAPYLPREHQKSLLDHLQVGSCPSETDKHFHTLRQIARHTADPHAVTDIIRRNEQCNASTQKLLHSAIFDNTKLPQAVRRASLHSYLQIKELRHPYVTDPSQITAYMDALRKVHNHAALDLLTPPRLRNLSPEVRDFFVHSHADTGTRETLRDKGVALLRPDCSTQRMWHPALICGILEEHIGNDVPRWTLAVDMFPSWEGSLAELIDTVVSATS